MVTVYKGTFEALDFLKCFLPLSNFVKSAVRHQGRTWNRRKKMARSTFSTSKRTYKTKINLLNKQAHINLLNKQDQPSQQASAHTKTKINLLQQARSTFSTSKINLLNKQDQPSQQARSTFSTSKINLLNKQAHIPKQRSTFSTSKRTYKTKINLLNKQAHIQNKDQPSQQASAHTNKDQNKQAHIKTKINLLNKQAHIKTKRKTKTKKNKKKLNTITCLVTEHL